MAGDKLWVAGVELAKPASPRRKPRTRGVELRSPTPATRSCHPHLNHAQIGGTTSFSAHENDKVGETPGEE